MACWFDVLLKTYKGDILSKNSMIVYPHFLAMQLAFGSLENYIFIHFSCRYLLPLAFSAPSSVVASDVTLLSGMGVSGLE